MKDFISENNLIEHHVKMARICVLVVFCVASFRDLMLLSN